MTTETIVSEPPDLFAITCAAISDIGCKREENQDSYGIVETDQFRFYFVADGMGGVKGGAQASQLTINVVKSYLENRDRLDALDLESALQHANLAIFEKALQEPQLTGMGTTFVGLCFMTQGLCVVNVGDSRAYRIRNQTIEQLTKDHTLVNELLHSGAITEDQVANHPVAHMLTRSLGPMTAIEIDCDFAESEPQISDLYLLCSDGLYNLVTDQEIASIVTQRPKEQAVKVLVGLANERGGNDNITIIIVEVSGGSGPSTQTKSEFKLSEETASTTIVDSDVIETLHLEEGVAPENPDTTKVSDEQVITNGRVSSSEIKSSINPEILHSAKLRDQEVFTYAKDKQSRSYSQLLAVLFLVISVATISSFLGAYYAKVGQTSYSSSLDLSSGPTDVAMVAPPELQKKASAAEERKDLIVVDQSINQIDLETSKKVIEAEQSLSDINQNEQAELEKSQQADQSILEVVRQSEQKEGEQNLSSDLSETNIDPVAVEHLEKIKLRYNELAIQIAAIEKKLLAFTQPLSGLAGEILKAANSKKEALVKERQQVLNDIDKITNERTVWYGRGQRLSAAGEIKIAAEIADSSQLVKKKHERFTKITWSYLKVLDNLRHQPNDVKLKAQAEHLLKERKKDLQALGDAVQVVIAKKLDRANQKISELNLRRDQIDEDLDECAKELDYVRALLGKDESKKRLKQTELQEELALVKSEYQHLEDLLNGTAVLEE